VNIICDGHLVSCGGVLGSGFLALPSRHSCAPRLLHRHSHCVVRHTNPSSYAPSISPTAYLRCSPVITWDYEASCGGGQQQVEVPVEESARSCPGRSQSEQKSINIFLTVIEQHTAQFTLIPSHTHTCKIL
jgi:hypothetical protein